ncbi:MFS transporter [Rhodoferax ferrireducens]|uniref:MFS transporter n=1 Tax=Rhodoferax ferrireducens TaxID=192843 RepID=UPI001FC8C601|nr:MFS transporter [Rhodoferax ferrireducens]
MLSLPRSARLATNVHFFLNGLAFATWGVHVPTFKHLHGLSEAEVALAMLAAGVGALVAVLWAGALVGRFGARAVCAVSGLMTAAAVGALLQLPSYWTGVMGLFVFGVANSLFDVAMNAHAVEVEAAYGRPIMSSCHGFFSLGGLGGAALASLLAVAGVAATTHTLWVAIGAAALTIAVVPAMLPDRAQTSDETGYSFMRPRGVIVLLGAMAALGLVAEGAMYDWSVLYLRESLASPQALAALAYASFSVAMAIGRFAGDRARARLGALTLLSVGGTLAASAMLAVLLIGHPVAALAGFALVGLGISNVVPVLFSCASRVPGISPAHGISGVASLGYLGFLSGPPIIGAVAQVATLPVALCLVALFAAALAVLARRVLPIMGELGTSTDDKASRSVPVGQEPRQHG